SLIGAGLFFISYGKVGYCFEVARVDSLFLFLLVAGSVVMVYAKSVWMVIFGAVLLALSYFTKQSTMVFLPGLLLLLYFRNKKNAVIFLISIVVLILGGTLLLDSATSGWYGYYTLDIPSAKRKTFRWDEGITEFFGYVILRCWAITIGVQIVSVRNAWRKSFAAFLRSNEAIFSMLLLSALATAFLGLGNEGGGKNVLLPLAAYSAILLPIAVARSIKTSTKAKQQVIWLSLVAIQFFALVSDPYLHPRNIPTKADIRNQEVFIDSLRATSGEVWVPYHSFMPHMAGKETFAELRAYGDVLLMEDSTAHRLKHDLDSALAAHKFSAIYDDMPDSFPGYRLLYGAINLHKAQALADTLIYVYLPK
ncbi:MAG: hypothetical protein Q8896_09015, partial [Bacteroidota bacterium]|nr:hypothetical protein [Bacteroidota bacterium]